MATGYFWDSIAYAAETFDTIFEELHVGLGADAQCVLRGVANELSASGATSPVVVATGAAFAKGKYRRWTGTTNVAIATPAVSTRVDRIVVAVDFAAKTVEIATHAGAEGAGVPALTQIDGTLWEVPLWQASITTGGVITLTDDRTFLRPPIEVVTAMLRAGLITADATGRALMASGFFDAATVAAKFGTDSFTNAVLLQLIQDGAFAATAATRALFATGFVQNVKLASDCKRIPGETISFADTVASLGGSDGRRLVVGGTAYEGWLHCDGGAAVNGYTPPDLRGYVVAGADGSHAAGTTGGANTADASHTHAKGTLADSGALAGSHTHTIAADTGGAGVGEIFPAVAPAAAHSHGGQTGGGQSAVPHQHGITGSTATGGSATLDVRQPTRYMRWFMYVGE
jgi:hypothetical protein